MFWKRSGRVANRYPPHFLTHIQPAAYMGAIGKSCHDLISVEGQFLSV